VQYKFIISENERESNVLLFASTYWEWIIFVDERMVESTQLNKKGEF